MKSFLTYAILGLTLFIAVCSHAGEKHIAYPSEYRHWTHVKTMVIEQDHPLQDPFAGIHHVYANTLALSGLKTGHYNDGAVFVFDLLKSKNIQKTVQEGERKLLGVMKKDSKFYAATGGWGFEGFAGDSHTKRLVQDNGKSCFACHQSQQDSGFVFSKLR